VVHASLPAITLVNDAVGAVTGSVSAGGTTDDSQPTLSGTLAAGLQSGEVLQVYDGTTLLGQATVSGTTWSFRPGTTLSDGNHTFQLALQSASGNALALANMVSSTFAITVNTAAPTATASITNLTDNVNTNGSVGTTGTPVTVATGTSTDDTTPTLSGTVSAALGAGQVVAIYDLVNGVSTRLGTATVTGTTWTYTTAALSAGSHSFTARVENPTSGTSTAASSAWVTNIHSGLTFAMTDDVGATQGAVTSGGTTDDSTPTFSGTLTAALGTNEQISIYSGSTRLGAATVNGLNWTFTPTSQADGSYTFSAVVEDITTGTLATGRVISTSSALTIATAAPTTTASITNVTDNVNTNGSVGTTGTPVTVTAGTSTDDTTPTLSGTVSAALGTGQVLAIYDTVNGVTTRLGTTTFAGTSWTFTPTALSAGSHSFTARVENPGSGAVGASSTAWVTNIHSGLTFTMTDDVGATQGTVASGGTTDDSTPTFSGTLTAALGTNEQISIYSGSTRLGAATVNGLNWSFTPTGQADGTYTFAAVVEDATTGTLATGRVISTSSALTIVSAGPTATASITNLTDNANTNGSVGTTGTPVTVTSGTSTDDTTPTLSGTVSAALGTGQVVALYDTVNGVSTRLGTATVTGTSWTYTTAALAAGSHSFTARVENPTSGASTAASSAWVANVHSGLSFTITDDVGPVQGAPSSAFTAYRYILVKQTGASSNELYLNEVEAYAGGVNVAAGRTVTAGVSSYGGFPLSGVTDGSLARNNGYAGQGATTANWVMIDLGSAVALETIRLYALSTGDLNQAQNLDIFVANQDISGFTYAQLTSGSGGAVRVGGTGSAPAYTTTVAAPATTVTDDNTPTLAGTLSVAIDPVVEEVAIYDTVGGVTSKIGTATLNGLAWSFTPTALPDGAHSLQAVVQLKNGTNIAQGEVISTSTTLSIDTAAPTATASITSLTDNANTNGSVGTTGTPVTVTSGTSTDDTTPTLSGTISAALGTGQVVALYDTVNGVSTRLGTATVTGTSWTYTTAALAAGSHSFTARVENPTSGASTAASSAWVANIHSGLTFTMTDDVGATQGTVAAGGTTDDSTPTFSGTLSVALGSNEQISIYRGSTRLGAATVNGLNWTFTPTSQADGTYTFAAVVEDQATGTLANGRVISAPSTLTITTAAPTATASITNVTDNFSSNGSVGSTGTPVTVATGTSTDDTTPTLSGTVSAALGTGQVVALYDTVNGVSTRLGTATVTGTTWTYTTAALAAGSHSFTARVENPTSGASTAASSAWVANVHSGLTLTASDDVGAVQGAITSPASYRYILVKQTGASSNEMYVNEIEAYVGGTNVALGKTATAGASPYGGFPASGVTDGSYVRSNGYAGSGNTTANWVLVDLGSAFALESIKLYALSTSDLAQFRNIDFFVANQDISALTYAQLIAGTSGAVRLGGTGASPTYTSDWSFPFTGPIDDNTPTLAGTLTAAIGAGEEVAIYDTTNGVTTRIGEATLNGLAWSFTPGTALADGTRSLQAVVQPSGSTSIGQGQVISATSTLTISTAAPAATASITNVTDNLNTNGSVGNTTTPVTVASGTSTDDTTPTLSGTVSAALGTGQVVGIYDTVNGVTTKLGNATVTGTGWTYTPTVALSAGSHSFTAKVENTSSGAASAASSAWAVNVHSGLTFTATDDVGATQGVLASGSVTDDNTPTLAGTLTAAIDTTNEEVAIYDTFNGVTTKIGAVALSGLTWSFTAAALPDGTHSLQAVVQPKSSTGIGQGEVISAASAFTVSIAAPTATASITNLTDNLNTNGSIGSVGTPATVASGTSTDDTTPTLSGTVSAVLGAGQVVGIYDTLNGVTTKLGNATVTGTGWTYTPSALAAGTHSFTAKVENTAAGTASAASSAWVANIHTGLTFTATDDVGATQGVLISGSTTDDNTPTLAGTLTAAIDTTNEEVAVYDTFNGVTTKIGAAALSGLTWSFTAAALPDGTHSLQAVVQPKSSTGIGQGEVISAASAFTVSIAAPTATASITAVTDNVSLNGSVGSTTTPVSVASGSSTDDTTPTLSGTVSAALGTGQVVAIYDTVGGNSTRLGTATVTGTNWTYTPSTLGAGSHSFTARVENPSSGASTSASSAWVVNIHSGLTFTATDDVGAAQGTLTSGSTTDDNTPTLAGTLTAAIDTTNEEVAIYDTFNGATTRIGAATLTGLAWSFTPGTTLPDGTHTLQAVVQPKSSTGIGQGEVISAATAFTVSIAAPTATVSITAVTDNASLNGSVGSTTTPAAVASGTSTDDTTPTLSGTISTALPAGQVVGIYDTVNGVTTKLGNATVTGTTWTYTTSALAAGSHSFTARVESAASGTAATASSAWAVNIHSGLSFTATDDVGATQGALASGSVTDDNTPTLSGTLTAAINAGTEEVAIYETINGVTSRIGAATVNGLAWSFTPAALTDGTRSLQAVVQPTGTTSIALGEVISAATTLTVSTATPTATASITGITDNASLNGSVGTTTTPAAVASGASTDDTTPTLSGTVSAALAAGQVVGIYDTVNGVTLKLGNATVTGTNWTYTPSALSAGSHSFTAQVENAASGAASTASSAWVANIHSGLAFTATDDVGTTQGVLASGSVTDDNTPTLAGTLTAALGAGEEVAVYDTVNGVTTRIGAATLSGLSWSFTPPTALADGTHSLQAVVQPTGTTNIALGEVVSAANGMVISIAAPTAAVSITGVTDNVSLNGSAGSTTTPASVASGTSTDDTTPTLSGTVSTALPAGQVVGIYDTLGGVTTKLGNATVSGTSWTYTPSALTAGSHSFTAKVESAAGGASTAASSAWVVGVQDTAPTLTIDGTSTQVRYILVKQTGGGIVGFSIAELQVFDSAGNNVALGKPVTSKYNFGNLGNAVDGDSLAATSSSANTYDAWLQVDLGGLYTLSQVKLIAPSGIPNRYVDVFASAQAFSSYDYTSLVNNPAGVVRLGGVGAVSNTSATFDYPSATTQTKPTLSGTLAAALGSNEELAVYDTFNGVTTKVGVAAVSGLNWTLNVGTDLPTGTHSLQAVVQAQHGTSLANGLVVSAPTRLVVDAAAPAATATITGVTDDLSANGSAGSAAAPASVANGASTDDSTPTINGTLSAALTAGQSVGIYDTVNGVTSKIGFATVSGTTWTYTPGALASGAHSFTAKVEGAGSAVVGSASNAWGVQLQDPGLFVNVAGATTSARYILVKQTGTSAFFTVAEVQVWDKNGNNIALGKSATVAPYGMDTNGYSIAGITDGSIESNGYHTFQSLGRWTDAWVQVDLGAVYDISGVSVNSGGFNDAFASTSSMSAYTYAQLMTGVGGNVVRLGGAGSNGSVGNTFYGGGVAAVANSTPAMSGKLSMALGTGEEVAIYDTFNGVTTKLGTAVVSGTGWTFTPGTTLPDGAHSLQAVVQTQGNNAVGLGSVVGPATVISVVTAAPTQTAAITSVVDDFSSNGSIGSAGNPVAVASGTSTDDTTPTLGGTVSGALATGLVVGIYDTVGGTTTKLGNATVTGTSWTFTPPTALAAGSHSFTAKVENPGSGAASTASAAWAANIHNSPTFIVGDDAGSTQGTVPYVAGSYRYVLVKQTGVTSNELYLNELEAYAGGVNVALGKAVTAGNTNVYTGFPVSGVTDGSYVRSNGYAGAGATSTNWVMVDLGAAYTLDTIKLYALSNTDLGTFINLDIFVANQDISGLSYAQLSAGSGGAVRVGGTGDNPSVTSTSTVPAVDLAPVDDNTPTLNGTLAAAIDGAEEVAIYDTFNGVTTKLGAAVVSGSSWSFTPGTALPDGTHNLQAVVQSKMAGSIAEGKVVGAFSVLTVSTVAAAATAAISNVTDDASGNGSVGSASAPAVVANGSSTDDTTPTLNGTLTGTLGSGQVVAVYDTVGGVTTRLGTATVSGQSWSFTPSSPVAAGSHSFTAKVENPASGTGSTASAAYGVNVQSLLGVAITDDVGSQTGNQWQVNGQGTARYVRLESTNALGVLSVGDVQVWAWVSGTLTNVALGKDVRVRYAGTTGSTLSSVVDGNASTAYTAGTTGSAWLQIDLGQSYIIQSITVAPRSGDTVVGTLRTSQNDMTLPYWSASTDTSHLSQSISAASSTQIEWAGRIATDDTTPTLSGTLSAALGSGEVVSIWDGNIRLGTATVSGTSWTYTTPSLTNSLHSLSAKIESASGQVLASSTSYAVGVDGTAPSQAVAITGATTDQNGTVSSYAVSSGGVTDNHPTLTGIFGSPALTTNEQVAIYDGSTRLGYATVTGAGTWSFQVMPGQLSAGTHNLTAVLENPATGAQGTASAAFAVDVQSIGLTSVLDDVGGLLGNVVSRATSYVDSSGAVVAPTTGTIITDDSTPTFGGTLGHALGATQSLVIYDGATRLGTATVSGTTWSYAPTALSAGSHSLSFQIEDSSTPGVAVMKTGSYALTVTSAIGGDLFAATSSSNLSVSNAGLIDLTAVSGSQQPAFNKVTLGGTGVSGITLKLDSDDVLSAAIGQYTSSTGTAVGSDGRHQLLIDGTTATSNTVNVADSGWTSAGTTTINGKTYLVYNHDTTLQLLIDSTLNRAGAVM
jgi:hypothetical protein